jgi:hypothetical protein
VHFVGFLALRADRAHEPHRHHALQRRGDHERLQADVDQRVIADGASLVCTVDSTMWR